MEGIEYLSNSSLIKIPQIEKDFLKRLEYMKRKSSLELAVQISESLK